MPKYLVTASVDAFANYETVIQAANADEAREAAQAEWETNSLAWQRADISEFDHVDFDNIEPEEVADDFTLEPAEDLTAELLAALKFSEPYIIEWVDMFDPSDEADADVKTARDECRRGLAALQSVIAKAGNL